jgi:hypothetical protein
LRPFLEAGAGGRVVVGFLGVVVGGGATAGVGILVGEFGIGVSIASLDGQALDLP